MSGPLVGSGILLAVLLAAVLPSLLLALLPIARLFATILRLPAVFRVAFRRFLLLITRLPLLSSLRRWHRLRRCLGIDDELRPGLIIPVRNPAIRLRFAVVFHNGPILDAVPGGRPDVGWRQHQRRRQRADMLGVRLPGQAVGNRLIPVKNAILKTDPANRKIRIPCGRLHSQWCVRRHLHGLLHRLHDPHLRWQVGCHLNPMPDFFGENLVGVGRRQLLQELIAVKPGTGPRLIEPQRKTCPGGRQVVRGNRELPILPAVASKIDPGPCKRQARLRNQRHPRSLKRSEIPLPLHGLRGPPRVVWKLITHLPNQQRRHVHQHHPHWLGLPITSEDRALGRSIHAAVATGQHNLVDLATSNGLVTSRSSSDVFLRAGIACPPHHWQHPGRGHVWSA